MKQKLVWLASYPRSGNTLLRTVLWHCFGLHSASVYPSDFGGDKNLAAQLGHIEHDPNGGLRYPAHLLPLIKTHEYPADASPAVYMVRDGRAACVSMWYFYSAQKFSLDTIIKGQHQFGTWAAHVTSWQPWARPGTLLLKYEDIISDLPTVLDRLARFLNREQIADRIPERNDLAAVNRRWVRRKSDWRDVLVGSDLTLFNSVNGDMMRKLGYPFDENG